MTLPPSLVLFDIGNVLIDWNPYQLFEELIPDETERAYFHSTVCPREWWIQHDAGARFEDIADPVCEKFPSYHDLIWAWHERYLDLMPGVIQGSVDILMQLKSRGMEVRGLTNWAADKFQIALDTYDFLHLLDDVVVSGEVGVIKPDPKIFQIALKRARRDAREVIFIDDHLPNIEAATVLGFLTHHFSSASALEQDLRERGLL